MGLLLVQERGRLIRQVLVGCGPELNVGGLETLFHRVVVHVAVDFHVVALLGCVRQPGNGHTRCPFVRVSVKTQQLQLETELT